MPAHNRYTRLMTWRRGLGAAGALATVAVAAMLLASPKAAAGDEITVYMSPACGCCKVWARHMAAEGFNVVERHVDDVGAIKSRHGVPAAMTSCHTAVSESFVFEGHVPPDLVRKVLSERPAIAGLAVPGMPAGSPGMEGPVKEPYTVFALMRDGSHRAYADR